MRSVLRIAGLAAAVLAVAAIVFVVPTVWGKPWVIEHYYARVFVELIKDRPMLLSMLRLLEPYGLDYHSDDLGDFSVARELETAEQARGWLEGLRDFDRESQSESRLFSTDVLGWFLDDQVRGEPFLFHNYPVNQMDGIQSRLPDFMLNVHQVHDERDARNYVKRLSRFGAALDQVIEGLEERESRGVVPPRFVVERVQVEVAEFVVGEPAEHVLVVELASRLDEIEAISEAERDRFVDAARREVEDTVFPAYARLAVQLDRMHAVAGTDDGVWRLPDGEAYYAWALRHHTTTNRTAEEIHELGRAEVERIHAEMRVILEAEGLPADDLSAALQALNEDERFLYPDDDAGRAQILADYQAIIDDANSRLPAIFGILPMAPVVVERVPEFKEDGSAGAYYFPAPFDGSKPGVFYANLRSVREIPRFGMRTLTYHEAIPGHHLQIAIAQEMKGVPFFRRVLPFTAFVEGWALYAERLAAEHGFHPSPYDRLGQLVAEVFRAVRLVVDTGIHAKRWTREQAIDYMLCNTGMPRTDVVAEIERYIVLPGQATAYKIGQLTILELRARARDALGEEFDLREFHDVVLGQGALPLEILEVVVDDWIAKKRAG